MRSGSETSDRCAYFYDLYVHELIYALCSVKGLEAQVSDLEAETARLSRALEQQRSVSAETVSTINKKVEEFSRELQKKVTLVRITHQLSGIDRSHRHQK
jgi:vacuolar-type H+-ATPase subunit I/STV1